MNEPFSVYSILGSAGKERISALEQLFIWHLTSFHLALMCASPFVNTPLLAIGNPAAGLDRALALWFHNHLTPTFVSVLRGITEFGSSEWIAVVLAIAVGLFIFKRWWPSL